MLGLLKNEGVQQMVVSTLGGELGRGQDVTIILIPKGGSSDQILALIHLHSHVLSTHSKYFNTCLSDRWDPRDSPSASMEFLLEVQTDVQYYFDCFSNMYSPLTKSFESVKYSLELLKVASQIDFGGLMERICFFLSSMYWSEEEEIRVREYAASPDLSRIYLKDLVVRLGLDESEEDCQKQLYVLLNDVFEAYSIPSVLTLPAFLEAIRCASPSEYFKKVAAILTRVAKEIFLDMREQSFKVSWVYNDTFKKIRAMSWILEVLLKGQVAEELVQSIVHSNTLPEFIIEVLDSSSNKGISNREFAELVLLMYKEVVAGRLILKLPERMALLANWHAVLKSSLEVGTFEQASADLFLTLPLKQQAKLIHLQKERVFDFISISSLASVLHFH